MNAPRPSRLVSASAAAFAVLLLLCPSAWSATFTVASTADSGAGTLRAAMTAAEANDNIGETDTIEFSLATGSTIQLAASLPTLAEPVLLDGCSESPNSPGPCVGIRGIKSCPTCNGGTGFNLQTGASGSTIRGFALSNLGDAIAIGADGVTVKNNWIGFTTTGASEGNGHQGMSIGGNSNVIGGAGGARGASPADRNVFGNNNVGAIHVFRGDGNTIAGNYFGVAPDGTTAAPNGPAITVNGLVSAGDAAVGTIIGGTPSASAAATPSCDGPCNVIASSVSGVNPNYGQTFVGHGIDLVGGQLAAAQTTISGNHIGVDVTGSAVRGNQVNGVNAGPAPQLTLGGSSPAEGNLVVGSGGNAIDVAGGDNGIFTGNLIGTNAAGAALGNAGAGIAIGPGSTGHTIGGSTSAEENVISHSGGDAIEITGADSFADAILRNRGRGNGDLFVDLAADGPGNPAGGPNSGIQAPTLASATTLGASGTAAPEAVVRVFSTSSVTGSLESFLGQASADSSGNWSVAYSSPVPNGRLVTASQSVGSNSSELPPAVASADATAPETTITSGPSGTTSNRTPSFEFSSSEAASTFECSVDSGAFASCSSPHTVGTLGGGPHTFEVRARDAVSNLDPTPASRSFTVATPADEDGDGVPNETDNCRSIANADQANGDGDAAGDACDSEGPRPALDSDQDGRPDTADNCPTIVNADQADADGSSGGDACDPDDDNDGLDDSLETTRGTSPFDLDSDDDGLRDSIEVVATETDPARRDSDRDGLTDGLELGVRQRIADPAGSVLGTDPARFKRDRDPRTKTDPLKRDTDSDRLQDGREDGNRNGRRDRRETDPLKRDSDGDRLIDGRDPKPLDRRR